MNGRFSRLNGRFFSAVGIVRLDEIARQLAFYEPLVVWTSGRLLSQGTVMGGLVLLALVSLSWALSSGANYLPLESTSTVAKSINAMNSQW